MVLRRLKHALHRRRKPLAFCVTLLICAHYGSKYLPKQKQKAENLPNFLRPPAENPSKIGRNEIISAIQERKLAPKTTTSGFNDEPSYGCREYAGTKWHDCYDYFNEPRITSPVRESPGFEIQLPSDCSGIKELLGLEDNAKQGEYPIGYVFLVRKTFDFHQLLHLLRAFYMPEHQYCFIMDPLWGQLQVATNVLNCYPNILHVTQNYLVSGYVSELNGTIRCIELLQAESVGWEYIVTLPAYALPLQSNAGIVKILRSFNGGNNILLHQPDSLEYHQYYTFKWQKVQGSSKPDIFKLPTNARVRLGISDGYYAVLNASQPQPAPPAGMQLYLGVYSAALHRDFIEFALSSEIGKKLRRYLSSTLFAHETFWATLAFNPHINAPGNYPGLCWQHESAYVKHISFVVDYQYKYATERPCEKRYILCLSKLADLRRLSKRPEMFSSTFRDVGLIRTMDLTGAIQCQVEHVCRIARGDQNGSSFNDGYYHHLPIARYNAPGVEKARHICLMPEDRVDTPLNFQKKSSNWL